MSKTTDEEEDEEINFERDNEATYQRLQPSKWDRVNPISKLFFLWQWPVFYRAVRRRHLRFEDSVFQCPAEDTSSRLVERLESQWKREQTSLNPKHPKFRRALFRCFAPRFVPIVLSFLFQELIVRVGQAYLLGNILDYFNPLRQGSLTQQEWPLALWSAIGFVGAAALGATTNHFNIALTDHVGLQMKTACVAMVYRKSLRLSQQALLQQTSLGQASNLIANDANRMIDYAYFAHSPIVASAQLILVGYLLYEELGWSSVVGLVALFGFVPLQGAMGRAFQAVRRRTAPLTDSRIRLLTEVVTGVQVIKLYAWERRFLGRMAEARFAEVAQIGRACLLKGVHLSLYYCTSRVVLFGCFTTFVYGAGGVLTARAVFVSMALFNVIRIPVTRHLPQSIASGAELLVACGRIQQFLMLPESSSNSDSNQNFDLKMSQSQVPKETEEPKNQILIEMNNTAACWQTSLQAFREVSFTLRPRELLTIVGPVGSGKTSLLLSIMDELPLSFGFKKQFSKNPNNQLKLAYAPQRPWLFSGSIRENVLFGEPLDLSRFQATLRATSLDQDLGRMPMGDLTQVGERGAKLSGGQRARVALARVLYSQADLILLDDPLSALDVHVAQSLVEKIFVSPEKDLSISRAAIILVTHQTQLIPLERSSVLVLDSQGRQTHWVRFDDSTAEREKLSEVLRVNQLTDTMESIGLAESDKNQKIRKIPETEKEIWPEEVESKHSESSGEKEKEKSIGTFTGKSKSQSASPYKVYFLAGFSGVNFTLVILTLIASQGLSQGSDFLLSLWTESFQNRNPQNGQNLLDENQDKQKFYSFLYGGMIGALFVATLLRTSTFFRYCMSASKALYQRSFSRVLLSPITFHHRTPSGRILNRFSRDTGILDDYVPGTAYELQMSFFDVLATLVIEAMIDWRFIFPAIPFLGLMWALSIVYVRTARELKRMEAIARNPIFSHLDTTLEGLAVVRCFKRQGYFEQIYQVRQDTQTSVQFSHVCATRGFAIVVEWLCVAYIAAITGAIMFLMTTTSPGQEPGLFTNTISDTFIGLSLSSCILLVGVTSWGVECRADLESQMSAVERIVQYAQLPVEFEPRSRGGTIHRHHYHHHPDLFPNGEIHFKNVTLSYGPNSPPALKRVTFHIYAGERVGIVGRTGAGKSSLITALFRLVDPLTEGSIEIDQLDLSKLALEELRSSMTVIPQDPILFSGTVRSNLEPFEGHQVKTHRLWSALEAVQLKQHFLATNQQAGLEAEIDAAGGNLSVGQRQLLCLARALLVMEERSVDNHLNQRSQTINDKFSQSNKKLKTQLSHSNEHHRILVLDEATSSVDHRTDQAIQEVIRTRFTGCTVITVAHRLRSVIHCDRVMVLEGGKVVEFDSPKRLLLSKPGSVFAKMVDRTGAEEAKELRELVCGGR